ncbi:MAG TPA: hypothetical protein VJ960_07575 [Oceanipulchritudo sp.]|nr:hypothetical protein [Oceanipulchritudo sp.]
MRPRPSSNILNWQGEEETFHYEPLYLANTHFGGLFNLTGTDANLWSAKIVGLPDGKGRANGVRYPVTAIRTQVYYQSPYFRERGFHVSNAAILSSMPGYKTNPSMPHKASLYHCQQHLNLNTGRMTASGTIYPGSRAALDQGMGGERAIRYRSEVVLLKGSPLMAMRISAEPGGTDIVFDPVPVLEDALVVRNSGNSIYSLGNALKTDLVVRQQILGQTASAHGVFYILQADGGGIYSVRVCSDDGNVDVLNGRPVLRGRDQLALRLEILNEVDLRSESPVEEVSTVTEAFQEQEKRWRAFWSRSCVTLPDEEATWQERYRASLFYVSQSLGDGPTHPVGLSQPMLPYWYGSFHDTDTYFCRPLLEAGHFEQAACNLSFRHRTLSRAVEIAVANGQPGALYPWQADPEGNGDPHFVPMNQAIIASEAWLQACHSGDLTSRAKALDVVEGVFENLLQLVDLENRPVMLLGEPVATFSETIEAVRPGEACLALRATAEVLLAAGEGRGSPVLLSAARRILAELPLPLDADGKAYAIVPDGDPEYLRCPSLTLGAFPLRHVAVDKHLEKTFSRELEKIVSLFAWMPHQLSCVASQLGRRDGPTGGASLLRQADRFFKCWHAYDEWENRRTARARIFVTAAGGFCTAIHHMLLSVREPRALLLFPGIPRSWQSCAFEGLTTPLGWTVSARLEAGKVSFVKAWRTYPEAPEVTICSEFPLGRIEGDLRISDGE